MDGEMVGEMDGAALAGRGASGPCVDVLVVGAGPAGLMAAEMAASQGLTVRVLDAMPSAGRKFLLAGKGGLNLTHSEAHEPFCRRYGAQAEWVSGWLASFGGGDVRDWAKGLGVETFVGTSGRVFPTEMKAAPLMRAWVHRLKSQGVAWGMRHRVTACVRQGEAWVAQGEGPDGPFQQAARAVVFAMGGGSWPRLGSDGAWVGWLAAMGLDVTPLEASNCGFEVIARGAPGWTPWLQERFAGAPLKSVAAAAGQADVVPAPEAFRRGECVVSVYGVEGSLVYALGSPLRQSLREQGRATLWLDLLPDRSHEHVLKEVRHPRGSRSWGGHLKSRLGLDGVKAGLLNEVLAKSVWDDPAALARSIKALPIALSGTRPMAEAISTAGGVCQHVLSPSLMVRSLPGLFCAGEMLDWDAPTGGYLLTACMASGRVAGQGAADHVKGVPA